MNARVLTLETTEHARLELLLPWYVNGTLGTTERSAVEAHLFRCNRCKSEVEFQSGLRELGDVAGVTDNTALGWDAMQARLDAKTGRKTLEVHARDWKSGWRLAWGVQCAASLVLALMLASVELRHDPYRTLGAASSAPTANALVVFRPGATEPQIRTALRHANAQLVGGPTESGAYLLQVQGLDPAVLDRLRAQPGVALAESLVAGGSP